MRVRTWIGVLVAGGVSAVAVAGGPGSLPLWLDLGGEAARASGPVRDVSAVLRECLGASPGLVAAVVRGERVVARGAAGVRVRGGAAAVTVSDRLHLGSCTKAMTGTLCALLVQDGLLKWDDTLPGVMPDASATMDAAWGQVTLADLLTHRSGVAGGPPPATWSRMWALGQDVRAGRALMVKWATERAPEKARGTFQYSNAGFTLAGAMAERATGKSWEELMQRRLFGPLGMSSAGFGAPGTATEAASADNAWGHRADGTPVPPGRGADNPPTIGPAGTVHATIDDWAKFAVLHLKAARGEAAPRGWPVLSPESVRRLHTAAEGTGREQYAMGWVVRPSSAATGDRPAIWHNGSNTMWYCELLILPGRDAAVLVAANAGGERGTKAVQRATAKLVESLAAEAGGTKP